MLKPLLTTRQKILLLLWLLVPVFYLAYWAIVLPAGPTGRGRLPVWMLMYVPLAAWQVLNDFKRMRRNKPGFVRLIHNRNYHKLALIGTGFMNAVYCYYIYSSTHPDTTDTSRWMPAFGGLFILLMGNYLLPLSRREYMESELTFNTPFMRRYGDLLVRAYRLVARLLVVGGAVAMVGAAWLPINTALSVAAGTPVAAGIVAFSVFWVWVARRRWLAVG